MQPATTVTIRGNGMDKYPAKAHAQRVADKLKMSNGLILLKGTATKFFPDSDQPMPFRQDRSFYYMTGCAEPGCFMTYETAKDKLTLWLPKIDLSRVFYDGRPTSTVEEAMEKYDIDEAKYIRGPKPKRTNLRKLLFEHEGEYAFFKMPRQLVGKPLRMRMKEKRKRGLRPAMKQCRMIKDEHEVRLIRQANVVTADAHKGVMERLSVLKSEEDVEAVFLGTCVAHLAKSQAYTPICGAGANAGQLHYVKNNMPFGSSQVLLLDAGAEWKQYASDVTRTMPLTSKYWPSEEAEAVYAAVEKIQEECIKQLRPGKKFIHVAWTAVHMAIDALLEMGVLKGDHMEIFHSGTVLGFFPHGLGHHLGLDVHDLMPPPGEKSGKKNKKGGEGKESEKKDGPKKQGVKNGGPNKAGMKNAGPKKQGMNGGPKKQGPKNGGPKKNNKVKKEVLFDAINEKLDENFVVVKTEDVTDEITDEKAPLLNNGPKVNGGPKKFGPKKQGGAGKKQGMNKKPGQKKNAKPNKVGTKKQAAQKKKAAAEAKVGDKRFKNLQKAYKAFSAGNERLYPQFLSDNPTHYSLNPSVLMGPNTTSAPALKTGMVITIEPGLYFNKFVLEKMFLSKPKHAKFIDTEVLEKFYPVGGVRIEDDILITKDGFENLSTAPKGDEMLKVISEGMEKCAA